MKKSWHLNRRTLLHGAGTALALPLLECMSASAAAKSGESSPTRLCVVYFPFGVSMPPQDHEHADWGWFPHTVGRDFQFTKPMQPLEPLREHVTVLSGLSHPRARSMAGHTTADTFLTGSHLTSLKHQNSISLDQWVAEKIGGRTRFPSLPLSSDGGVGERLYSTTLSFSRSGRPIPALASPRQIFARLFGAEQDKAIVEDRLKRSSSMLDLVLEHSRSLKTKLGRQDCNKLDEYLASVRGLERQVERAEKWLEVAKPQVDAESVNLDTSPESPTDYIRSMYDLMFLAFQTDSTRVATYMIGSMVGSNTVLRFAPVQLFKFRPWHAIAHHGASGRVKDGCKNLGRFDQYLIEQFAYFLDRLKSAPEGDGTILDRTMVLYGSSNSSSHVNRNYPLVLAGGRSLGFTHGQSLRFPETVPLANLFVTVLDRMNLPVKSFSDSTGDIAEVTR